MIQFNLLPDVKLAYIRTERIKHVATLVAMMVSVVAVGLLCISMSVVYVVQRQIVVNLDNAIQKSNRKLASVKDVDKILTVQNQLKGLTGLHTGKPATSRVFAYLQKTTPKNVSLNKLNLDFSTTSITVGGSAASLDDIKNYADILKSATYTVYGGKSQKAFSDVVLSNFSKNDKGATFTITAKFATDLFDITKDVTLSGIITEFGGENFQGGQ